MILKNVDWAIPALSKCKKGISLSSRKPVLTSICIVN
jgi:hypothetical protein